MSEMSTDTRLLPLYTLSSRNDMRGNRACVTFTDYSEMEKETESDRRTPHDITACKAQDQGTAPNSEMAKNISRTPCLSIC